MHRLPRRLRCRGQLALVKRFTGEGVEVGVQPVGLRQEETAPRIDDRASVEDELQRGDIHAGGMRTFLHLRKLLRVSQQDHVAGGARDGDDVGE